VAGVEPLESAGHAVQLGELAGDEAFAAELFGDGVIRDRVGLGQTQAGAAAVPVAAHGDRGQDAGGQIVADGVDDGQVGGVAVEGVVKGVPGDLVGWFQQPGDHDSWGDEGQWWEQLPLHLGGQAHGLSAAGQEVAVGVLALGHEQFSDQRGQPGAPHPQRFVDAWESEAEDAQALGAVQQRQPQPPAGFGVSVLDSDGGKDPTGQGGVDLQRRPVGAVGQGNQQVLLVVDQVDGDILGSHGLSGPSDRSDEVVRSQVVGGVQQVTKHLQAGVTLHSNLLDRWSASRPDADAVLHEQSALVERDTKVWYGW
jgi:hypothetical protein